MTRVTRGFVAKKRRKRILNLASGFRGANSVLFRTAQQRTLRALSLAYRDRRLYKRKVRGLWIRRLNTFLRHASPTERSSNKVANKVAKTLPVSGQTMARSMKLTYSSCMNSLKKANVLLNRKVLSQLAIFDPESLQSILLSL